MLRVLGWFGATILSLLLLATTLRTADVLVGSPTAQRTGVAAVDTCVEHGPIGRWGFGTSYSCTADVGWDDGETERLAFVPGQLRPGDVDVPVFLSGEGRGGLSAPGRNDSARWFLPGRAGAVVLGLLTLWLFIGSLVKLWELFRPRVRKQRDEQWPVTAEEIAASPVPRVVWRLRLLAALGLTAGALEVLASIPYFDAPRQVGGFRTPWPHLPDAWLVDPPTGTFLVVGAIVALLCLLIGSSIRKDAARIRKYGKSFVDTKPGLRDRRPPRATFVVGAVFVAIGLMSAVVAVRATPSSAPPALWLAGGRDALILLALAAVWWATIESTSRMLDRMSIGESSSSREPGAR